MPALGALIGGLISAFLPALKDLFFKILISLGVAFVSYKGFEVVISQALGYVRSNYFSLSPDILGFLDLAGIGQALNIVFGAFNFCVGLLVTGKAMKFFDGRK